jgi:hypothetical protein
MITLIGLTVASAGAPAASGGKVGSVRKLDDLVPNGKLSSLTRARAEAAAKKQPAQEEENSTDPEDVLNHYDKRTGVYYFGGK